MNMRILMLLALGILLVSGGTSADNRYRNLEIIEPSFSAEPRSRSSGASSSRRGDRLYSAFDVDRNRMVMVSDVIAIRTNGATDVETLSSAHGLELVKKTSSASIIYMKVKDMGRFKEVLENLRSDSSVNSASPMVVDSSPIIR